MKTQKIRLNFDSEPDPIQVGLVRLAKEIPDFELFYQINALNTFQFTRIEDFVLRGTYFDHSFARFEGYHTDSKICIHFISNKSIRSVQKMLANELFSGEEECRFLLPNSPEVDYAIKTSEPFDDFSLILHPENLMFKIQSFMLNPSEELYLSFQYYE